ncbi:Lactate utilization protein C [Austwickia sp. TVS 96-490-7B]|uniref:LutC/YkgG family protein n=1 Tax=Austwickia sp. TVS 96-490-7B TaxID=2830843 RepID=UPI001C56D3E5|nr:LUD domain-containing protein [Austwickia sp. TVS 96-490-7B]MBW3084596.1 Lactate utilization protein C [Austwickia sp. TVS 96-490-7B]
MSSSPTAAPRPAGEAKDIILGRIRTALRDVHESDPALDVPVDWTYHQPTAMPDVLERFVERVEDYKARVVRTDAAGVPGCIAEALVESGIRSVVLPGGLDARWCAAVRGTGAAVLRDEPLLTQTELDRIGAVVTAAAVGVAETGTIMLDHGPDQGRRALSLVPDMHICVVRSEQVVSDIPEAVGRLGAALREGRPATWISGPSATSDIELSRVEGVHGPRTLWVILQEG